MAKHPTREVLPGNDGRWYLELVGVVEPELESTDTYATLQALVPPATPDDTATVSTGAIAAAVNGALVQDALPSGEFVALAPGAATGNETARPSRRCRRWWSLGLALVLVAATISTAAYLLPRAAQAEAADAAVEHRAALVAFRTELPSTQSALADLTDPASNADAVSGVPVAVAGLSAASGRSISVATVPLPSTLPFVPRGGFERLDATRNTMTILGGAGSDLAGRISVGFTYRTAIDALFAVGPLPTGLEEAAITDLSIALAADLAEAGRLVAELRQDAIFIAVREEAATASQRYAIWQLEYLDALHDADENRAAVLVAELDATVVRIDRALDAALGAMRNDLDPLIVELASELEAAIDGVPG